MDKKERYFSEDNERLMEQLPHENAAQKWATDEARRERKKRRTETWCLAFLAGAAVLYLVTGCLVGPEPPDVRSVEVRR